MRISDWSSDVCSSDLFGASLDLCKAVDTIGGAVASSEKIVNPVLEIHPPGNVDAQHLGDHTDRKQRGKFPDEIELALAAMLPDDIIDQFMRDTADAVLHCPDPAGHERFVRQLADADMTRRIERNHRPHFGHWIILAQQRGHKLRP